MQHRNDQFFSDEFHHSDAAKTNIIKTKKNNKNQHNTNQKKNTIKTKKKTNTIQTKKNNTKKPTE